MMTRRVVALVLPELLCELAVGLASSRESLSYGVVLVEDEAEAARLEARTILAAASPAARRCGVCRGQTLAEARALVGGLQPRVVLRRRLLEALGQVAEAALAFGATVSIEIGPPVSLDAVVTDTVWVDITGCEGLFGSEGALLTALAQVVRDMGHLVRVAAASGPRLAQALARWSPRARAVEFERAGDTVEALAALPVTSLPIDAERAAWLTRLGLLTLGDLVGLPRAALAARLGEQAGLALDLCAGRDPTPLLPHRFPRHLQESVDFDAAVAGLQPLLFVVRGLVYRLSSRLAGRGEAALALRLVLQHDPAVARFRSVPLHSEIEWQLAAPLSREDELFRVVSARLESLELPAPTAGVLLVVPVVTRAVPQQLDFERVLSGRVDPELEVLPVLLAELQAEIGEGDVGVLECVDAHRPEARSRLVPWRKASGALMRSSSGMGEPNRFPWEPTRLLHPPVPLANELRVGATVCLARQVYSIKRLAFERRIDATEWWSPARSARDYVRLWLENRDGLIEALVFVDRATGARYLQAIAD